MPIEKRRRVNKYLLAAIVLILVTIGFSTTIVALFTGAAALAALTAAIIVWRQPTPQEHS